MNRILWVILSVLPLSAAADDKMCAPLAKLSADIMVSRQAGVTKLQLIEQSKQAGDFQPLYEEIVEHAFREPIEASEDARKEAVKRFGNYVYDACLAGEN